MIGRKKRLRGAISIFLVIILVSNYAVVGLLVDSGRQRMAKASAEMALDTAAASVLSYYDKMVYDLYGLFATDSLTDEKIENLLTDYVQKSLTVTEIDSSSAKKLTDAIVSAIFGADGKRVDSILFEGYDFQFSSDGDSKTVKFDSSNSISLAYTDAVEAQIIDHMKYRAPLSLVSGVGGFMEKLNTILNIADRLGQTISKMSEENKSKDKERLANDAAQLIRDIETYNKKLLAFSSSGTLLTGSMVNLPFVNLKSSYPVPYDPWLTIDALDRKFNDIGNNQEKYPELDPEDEDYEEQEEQIRSELRAEYEAAYQAFLQDWERVGDNALQLYNEANALRTRADQLNSDYNTYINTLKTKINDNASNENTKTLYLPEIELAESACGEALKNLYLVLTGRQYLQGINKAFEKNDQAMGGFTDNFIEGAVNQIIDNRLGLNPNADTAMLRTFITTKTSNVFAQQAAELMKQLSTAFEELYKEANEYEDPSEAKLKTSTEAPKTEEATKEDDGKEKEELRDLKKDDLKVDFKNTSDLEKDIDDWDTELDDSMDTENVVKLLSAGLDLIEKIGKVLEDARDSLYLNEYIISYFPNYVQHYNATNSPLGKKGADLISDSSYYTSFNATQAELEYVLSGNADTGASILSASAKLTAVRMIFNTIAIFTDTGKITQANALAAAISGPFAPLVAPLLLVAWALAESAMDTYELLSGENVLVFKQGTDWTFSLEGAAKKVVKKVVDTAVTELGEAIENKISEAAASVSSFANKAVYSAYQAATNAAGKADDAIDQAKNTLNQWANDIVDGMGPENSAIGAEFRNSASQAVDNAFSSVNIPSISDTMSDVMTEAKDDALRQINKGITKAEENLKEKSKKMLEDYGDQFTEWVNKGLEKYITVGNPENSGSSEGLKIEMNYLDYMRIFLMFYGNEVKVQRIQQLIQANIRYGSDKDRKNISSHQDFSMETAYINVYATMDTSIKFMFMSNLLLPESLRMDGRLKVSVYTDRSY